jgi:hypothetical protein
VKIATSSRLDQYRQGRTVQGTHTTICLTIPQKQQRLLARYSLEEAFVRLGLPLRLTEGEPGEGEIVYGPVPDSWRGAALIYDPRCYDPAVRCAAVGSPPIWAPEGRPGGNVDLVGGLGRLLTLADESQVAEAHRNVHGIFPVTALPPARCRMRDEPMVENHAAALAKLLRALAPGTPAPAPRWPHGRYAVVVTHDTDAVALKAPMEIFFNGAKAVLRRDPVHARMAWEGLTRKGGADPLFGFGVWADVEKAAGVRSAFFLFGRRHARRHLNDCRSTVFGRGVNWDLLRRLADEGWEFGFHPSIWARNDKDEFVWGREALEARLGGPVHGLRHHYWALDWRFPHLTFRKHVSAGFRYDASIAWRDDAGFRAGTCLPYRPFDPEEGHALDIYELPTAIMDWNVITSGGDPNLAVDRAMRIAESVRQAGGALVVDWHTETAWEGYCYRNMRTTLVALISELRASSDAWFTTPWELAQHWHERRQRLLSETRQAATAGT